jgi:hypothetical protein
VSKLRGFAGFVGRFASIVCFLTNAVELTRVTIHTAKTLGYCVKQVIVNDPQTIERQPPISCSMIARVAAT